MTHKNPLWRTIQKENFHSLKEVITFLQLSPKKSQKLLALPKFPLNLPRRLASKIKKNTLRDPILRQFIALKDELTLSKNFCKSPTADEAFSKTPQLLQKYEGRVLLLVTSACAMHCRFCFRQNYPYDSQDKSYDKELELIKNDPTLFEIILSGGDPLSLSDEALERLLGKIETIPHIKIVRFHTRFPIGIPERITDDFLALFQKSRLQFIFILHVNHPLELDEDVLLAAKKLQKLGIPILTHTVLLKGVNDNATTLIQLNTRLIEQGILPYYLNQLDRVQGSAHFEVSKRKGKKLCRLMREKLPGYGMPLYIEEVPFKGHKTTIPF
ncbi:MAG: KamA family radical SAM protein [Chlamydiae bacterium]|nr:KamA family radical SAM protein [Chlamydiota bacterium]